ncbi:MAG: fasciclin domain-containing protein [Pseudomonadota bacterium]
MSDPFAFEIRGRSFTIENGRIIFDHEPLALADFLAFVAGKIDLQPKPSIVDIVVDLSGAEGLDDNGADFDILREALAVTGLDETLADRKADFSVFAPTDDAFIQLARDLGNTVADGDEAGALAGILATLEALGGTPEAALAILSDILLYHVAPEGRTLEELNSGGDVATVNGADLGFDGTEITDIEPDLEDATVILEDVEAKNGVIQVIDRVLLPLDTPATEPAEVEPPVLENIVDIAAGSADFEILTALLGTAALTETVRNLTDITVFAPTDAAFGFTAAALGFKGEITDEAAVSTFLVEAFTALGDGDPIPVLTNVLLYHVAPSVLTADEIADADAVETLLTDATFGSEGSELLDNDPELPNPNIVIEDIAASNGTIQAIDAVLIPLDLPGGPVIVGTDGGERLVGTRDDDVIIGLDGNDRLIGRAGDDTVLGGDGNDRLIGRSGDDLLSGNAGNDVLKAGRGDDTLHGGSGEDTFHFVFLSGDNVIEDFETGDTIVLSRFLASDFDDLEIGETGGDAFIEGRFGSITVEGVAAAALTGDDFNFV